MEQDTNTHSNNRSDVYPSDNEVDVLKHVIERLANQLYMTHNNEKEAAEKKAKEDREKAEADSKHKTGDK